MSDLQFHTLDVFTTDAFGGNPLAVVLEAAHLSDVQMQTIAREFGYSETVFVSPPETAAGDAKIRIFTPTRELPFAGHPTIGTAICLAQRALTQGEALPGAIVLEEGVGPIACKIERRNGHLFATLTVETPLERGETAAVPLVAECLSLPGEAIATCNHLPCFASKGVLFLLVEITDVTQLTAAAYDVAAFRKLARLHTATNGDLAIAAYVRRASDQIDMRMMAPLSGTTEDPATGSAAAALGAFLCALEGCEQRFDISQGVAMGRPSRISVAATSPAANISSVTVAGSAVPIMQGALHVPPVE